MVRNKTLVVVDDDIDYREMILSVFKKHSVDVLGFQTGEEALEFLQEIGLHPDMIVLDIELKLGGLSGVEVAHHLRSNCGIDSPILFLSGEPHVEIWADHIPGCRALSKQNSIRRILSEITECGMDLESPENSTVLTH